MFKYKTHKRLFYSILLALLVVISYSQETPPILKFTPNVYKAENQNWSITQDDNKFIYVANNQGLLEYNGAKWNLYHSPNNTIVRSVHAFEDRIYCGAYMEFGYWKRNEYGILNYCSLSDAIKDQLFEDEEFWNIETIDNWVVFQSYDRLYFYNIENNNIETLTDKNNYYRIFEIDNALIVFKKNGGLYRIEEGKEVLISQLSGSFDIQLVLNVFADNKDLVIITRNKGLYRILDGKVVQWNTPSQLIGKLHIFSGIQLRDKSIMLGTISDGIFHISPDGNILNRINKVNGLSNNTILNMYEDRDGSVWAALDNGIDCLNMRYYIQEYNDDTGNVGTTYCSIIHNKRLYIGTNQGLFYKNQYGTEGLRFVNGTKGQVWALFEYNGDLLCGHTMGTFHIVNDSAILFSQIPGTWIIREIPSRPELLMQGNYSGISIIYKDNDQWKLKNKIEGFENSARFFETMGKNEIWINHEYKGIYKLSINDSLNKFVRVELYSDLPKGKGSSIVKYMDKLLYSFEEGIYALDTNLQVFKKDTLLSRLLTRDEYISGKLVIGNANQIWSFGKNNINFTERGPVPGVLSIRSIPIDHNLRKITVSFENISHLDNDRYIVGRTNGYLLIDFGKYITGSHSVFLNEVKVNDKDTSFYGKIGEQGEFRFDQRSLNFSYCTPSFNKYEFPVYQYKLEGYDNSWSSWGISSNVSFQKLAPGNYTFEVRSKVGNVLSNAIADYSFIIKRPYYWSKLAITAYCLLILLIVFFTHRFYKSYYQRQQQEIIRANQSKMEFQQIQTEQELIKLRNEKLNQEIDAKSRELAISAMNIAKRNRFLRIIKKELLTIPSLEDNSSVFKLIDQNLNNSRDEKMFREAFNNADKDFLNRAKKIHPGLTHNDLKFCAYLRINLSSKEIASLLNISSKSVEVRRYRLRKKMNLSHDINLIDHILGI